MLSAGLSLVILLLSVAAPAARPIRLTKPWSQISGLSPGQKQKLSEIHLHARAEIRKILEQQRRDSLAVLNQKQLDQLRQIEEKQMVERKIAATQEAEQSP